MKSRDRDAMAKLYMESWNDNPYIDDIEALKQHQDEVDRESGRLQPRGNRSFEDDPEEMDQGIDMGLENAKNTKIKNLLNIRDRALQGDMNASVNLPVMKQEFISWMKDKNLLDDPEVQRALKRLSAPRPYDPRNDPDSEYGGF